MRRLLAALLAVAVVAVGYLALDVYDVVPGFLTRDRPPAASPVAPPAPGDTAAVPVPVPTTVASAVPLTAAAATAPLPRRAAVAARLAAALHDPGLGRSVGVTVRDAFTGEHLLDVDAARPRVAASTQKLLTALAVGSTLDPQSTMATRVVQGAGPTELVLVAGGDTMLATGHGSPTSVEGRAGLADLASQVVAALPSPRPASVSLRLDLTYAAGPRYAPTWNLADVQAGYTQGVAMVGLAGQRPRPGHPSPPRPETQVASAFVTALKRLGVTARLEPEATWHRAAPPGAAELGRVESAPLGDVLALALDDSDNALTEGLARQAAVGSGHPATFAGSVAFVRAALTRLGVDLTGVVLKDTCGLSAGQAVPARVLGDVMALGANGTVPSMTDTLAELPVAGLTGTLHDRFDKPATHLVAGVARAKTGTLTGVSALAGTLVDRDGRVLTYAVLADRVPPGVGTLEARAALDRFVAALGGCGCS